MKAVCIYVWGWEVSYTRVRSVARAIQLAATGGTAGTGLAGIGSGLEANMVGISEMGGRDGCEAEPSTGEMAPLRCDAAGVTAPLRGGKATQEREQKVK
jgi:hypothetical protein